MRHIKVLEVLELTGFMWRLVPAIFGHEAKREYQRPTTKKQHKKKQDQENLTHNPGILSTKRLTHPRSGMQGSGAPQP